MTGRRDAQRHAVAALLCLAAAAPSAARADEPAGTAVLVQGTAWIKHDEVPRTLRYRDAVFVGDAIATGDTALVQLQMNDGALVSLRPQSTLIVAHYPVDRDRSGRDARQASDQTAGIVLRLVKGALRTVTGLTQVIGARMRDDYRLETPIATIGIRGTDYAVAVCAGDCEGQANGVYVGVFDGAVELANAAGRVVLERGEFAHVADAASAPRRQAVRPAALDAPPPADPSPATFGTARADDRDTTEAGDSADAPVTDPAAGAGTVTAASVALTTAPAADQRSAGVAIPGESGVATSRTASALRFDSDAQLLAVTLGDGDDERSLQLGSATHRDAGSDAATGLRWGRWSGGTATIEEDGTATPLDLAQQSLHWIAGPEFDAAPVLPRSGFAEFDLVGATSPTDRQGHTGTLGHAELVADFDRQVVFSSLDLRLAGDHWHAWGTAPLDGGALFSGRYEHVIVNLIHRGSGDFSGFFAGSGAVPDSAGLAYHLQHAGSDVSGVAAFALGDHATGDGGP